jgi:GNAT superfamily N-acetyltransferase
MRKKEIEIQKSEKGNRITIHKMVVPEEHRGKGIGTKHMNKMTQEADKKGKTITLSPSEDFGGGDPLGIDIPHAKELIDHLYDPDRCKEKER